MMSPSLRAGPITLLSNSKLNSLKLIYSFFFKANLFQVHLYSFLFFARLTFLRFTLLISSILNYRLIPSEAPVGLPTSGYSCNAAAQVIAGCFSPLPQGETIA